jgi:hypothetical protein
MKAKFSSPDGQEHVFEAEGFEVTTSAIYSTSGGKTCAGFQADWERNSKTWYIIGEGLSLSGVSFEAEEGLELSINGRKPFYAGPELVSVHGSSKGDLTAFVHDNDYRDCVASNPWGWLEQLNSWASSAVRERRERDPKKRGSLRIQPLGSSRPSKPRRRPLFKTPLRPSPRTRLSSLAERLTA